MITKNILQAATLYQKLASIHSIVTFHGTSAEFIPSIIENGLLPRKPVPSQPRALFLTNSIERAARYAIATQYPIVLEINLSSWKRIKKLQQDNLDRDEELYGDSYDTEPYFEDDTFWLKDAITKILNISKYNTNKIIDLDVYNLNDLVGQNIYKAILTFARNNGLNIQDIKRKIKEELPPQDLEYIKINEDGTITLLKEAYDRMHQMVYKDKLPAAAIKYFHIREKDLKEEYISQAVGKESFPINMLPGDALAMQEEVTNIIRSAPRPDEFESQEEIDEFVQETLQSIKSVNSSGLFDEFVEDCEKAKDVKELFDILEWYENEAIYSDGLEATRQEVWLKFKFDREKNIKQMFNHS